MAKAKENKKDVGELINELKAKHVVRSKAGYGADVETVNKLVAEGKPIVLMRGSIKYKDVVYEAGDEIVLKDSPFDRSLLGNYVFCSPERYAEIREGQEMYQFYNEDVLPVEVLWRTNATETTKRLAEVHKAEAKLARAKEEYNVALQVEKQLEEKLRRLLG